MGILRSILMKGMNGEVRRAFVERAKTPTIFALGFFASAALTRNSDEAKENQLIRARLNSVKEVFQSQKEIVKRLDDVERSHKEISKRDDLERRIQPFIEQIISSGVSFDEMDQEKQDDLVQTPENEDGIWDV